MAYYSKISKLITNMNLLIINQYHEKYCIFIFPSLSVVVLMNKHVSVYGEVSHPK